MRPPRVAARTVARHATLSARFARGKRVELLGQSAAPRA